MGIHRSLGRFYESLNFQSRNDHCKREKLKKPSPSLISLFASRPSYTNPDYSLAIRHAPILRFDDNEPFLPLAVGYTIIRESAHSPSFARRIEVDKTGSSAVAIVIEYAIWWTWDIVHLYELEHIWIFLDENEQVIEVEASWHGDVHDMTLDDTLPLKGSNVLLYSEPGKHAFSAANKIPPNQIERTRQLCRQMAGTGGLLLSPLFVELRTLKTHRVDQLVSSFLKKQAFEPSFNFGQSFLLSAEILVPWSALYEWIPGHLFQVIYRLENNISTDR